MAHHGHDQARRRHARELPRCRRRRLARARRNAFRLVLSDAKVQRRAGQHLRRHQSLRLGGQGRGAGLQELDPTVPLVVRLAGTNVEEGRKILADSGLELITADTLAEAAEKARGRSVKACRAGSGRGRKAMSILIDETHAGPRPGHDRRQGHVPRQGDDRVRHQRRRRRHARQRRQAASRPAGVQHGEGSGEGRPAPPPASSSCRPRSAPTRSWRRPTPASG